MSRGKNEQQHFDTLAKQIGETWWGSTTPAGIERLKRRAQIFKQKLNRFKQPKVLELGCGTGAFSKYILEVLPDLDFLGVDLSSEVVKIAQKRYLNYKNAKFEVADVSSMKYRDSSFDIVFGNSILHHLPLEISLMECLRVLKPGGFCWFSEPNMMNPQIVLEKNIKFIGKMLQNSDTETAFFRWSLKKKIEKMGFINVKIQPIDFLHPLIPRYLIGIVDCLGRVLEKIILFKEISGSLLIYAEK